MFLFLKWMENLLGSGKESKKMYKDKIAKKKKKKEKISIKCDWNF